ncbi:hypothetical protein SAMN05216225_100594 [Ornithinibacillus halophilus]|uniref:Uncharacterized protein n=2 Tax=Ornithinibacillus halophilus TaxID=930117 RepID=A0A1M5ENB5_9BACI|nr:hypothetical protein SAMN05216225_100594 [Ornithinibacillus halophilus]
MQKNGMWLPLIASVGVGAATYYTMSKNNQNLGQTVSKVVPFISQLTTGNSNSNSQKLGPYGMS